MDFRQWRTLEAERHMRSGHTQAAEVAYRRALSRQAGQKSALAGLGRLLLRERRFEEAVGVWRQLVDLEPHRPGPAFQFARALHRSGHFEAAALQYLRVVMLDPLHQKAFAALDQLTDRLMRPSGSGATAIDTASLIAQQLLTLESGPPGLRAKALGLAAALRSKSDPDAAIGYWEQLAELKPRAIEPRLRLARFYSKQRRRDEALRYYHAVLDLDPNHTEALLGFGQAVEPADQVAAIRHFSAWSKRDPKDAAPRLELARLYQNSKAWDQAEATYRDILDQMPDNSAALTRFAQVLSRNLTRVEPALDVWQRIAERDPAAPFPLVQRAQLLERVRRLAEAEAEYLAALARGPHDEAALFGLARLLAAQSRWDTAVSHYNTLHDLKPRRTDVLLGFGRCLERLDRAQDALAAYDKVLTLDPTNSNGLLYRGRLLRQLGRTEEAIRTWQEICERTPQNADAWYELVFMLATMERDGEALAALDTAEAALPTTPASWVRLGLAAQAGQFNERAVNFFERAMAAEPQEAGHRARLGQHYLRRGILDGAFHHLLASRELKPNDVPIARQLVETIHGLNVLGIDHLALQAGPQHCGHALVPEGLFQRVRELADSEIAPYVPVPRRVIAVSSSLAGGGAERQLVNVLRGLSDPSFGLDLTLFCISLARRTRRDFFLPLLEGTPVEIVTPDNAALETYLAEAEVAPYARLIRAFPPDMVVPIAFWLGEFRRRRPEVVHAWQDGTNLTAVVAALLAGVPRIVLG
ncbi:MAG: tetratricopeptide repeat protein, partial [Hyphomicrobiales bacterium]